MSHNLLSKTGLQYFWGKLKAFFVKGNAKVFFGTCDTAAATADKVVTCSSFTSSDLENGSMILVKFSAINTADSSDLTLNVNGTGALPIRKVYNAATEPLTREGEIRGITHLFVLGTTSSNSYWYLVGSNINTLYSAMTQSALDTGTATTGRIITAKLLRDNFYLKSEIPTFVHLTSESQMPATPDANTIYMINVASSSGSGS